MDRKGNACHDEPCDLELYVDRIGEKTKNSRTEYVVVAILQTMPLWLVVHTPHFIS